MSDYTYVGAELTLFAAGRRWKSYLRRHIAPLLGPDVLEVGSGLGGTSRELCRGEQRRPAGLEQDRGQAGQSHQAIIAGELPPCSAEVVGTIASLGNRLVLNQSMPTRNQVMFEDDSLAGQVSEVQASSWSRDSSG